MKKRQNHEEEPIVADGITTQEELDESATPEEVAKGDYTKVVTLSLDENDPSWTESQRAHRGLLTFCLDSFILYYKATAYHVE